MTTQNKAHVGRPRGFDADEALRRAMLVFWEQGYEGASLADLTGAMGITKTSMYAAFGNKEQLFRKALARYDEGPASYGPRAWAEPTAAKVAAAILNGAVEATTDPDCPPGCLGVQGSLAAGELGLPARELLVEWRNAARRALEKRFQRAVDEHDLPPSANSAQLARYIMTVAFGIAVEAASGASREELQEVADTALRNWPDFQRPQ
ncbi:MULTISPECIES: TetR/AcrR family transcriptional regulator [Amycolatopsis]|uniref:TetR/AcrR family transcriptional regulator n=1 Tax=Amycolatopsis albidoflavus TaxID=102226 RepID=A0ABW5HV26_9PSEU